PGTYTFKVVDVAGNEKLFDVPVTIVSDGLEVKFIDQVTNEEIATKEHIDGLENDTYTTTAKTVDGYELVKTPTNKDGKLTVGLITVTYEYRKNSNVIVKYLDENYGTEIIQNVVTKYKEGDSYTTEEKLFDGYQITSKTDNTSGTVVREDIVVEYRYKKVSAGVDTKFIDQVTGEEIETVVHQTGLEKDAYTTTPKTIDGYELVKTPDNAKGNMTVDLITVTYEYRKNSNVTVKYIDENYNTNIIEDIVTKYKEGDTYTTEEKTFEGYQLTRKTDNTSGTVVRDNIEVVYYYKKISAGVDVKYIDQATGLNIAYTEHLVGLEKDPYETEPKDIDDYILVFTPDNKDGEMVVDLTTVVYEYRMLSDVTTKFIDENYGTEITEEVKQTYKQGDPYSTKAKNLDGYQLVGQTNNTNGMVEREDIVVEYKYKKISAGVETKYIDQVTKEEIATPTHQSGLEKDAYTTSAKDVAGYELVLTPDNKDGEMIVDLITVTYEYRKNSNVIVKYLDENYGTSIIEDVVTKY
ncbi:MAG: MucBP domain-containing protein, partial [Clostridia bacterium]|nr:MucBP domain-containing protein [Clostridia bacterium]